MTCCLIPDLQGFGIEFNALNEKLIVVKSEGQIHFADSLIFCAEKQPKLISRNVSRDLDTFPRSNRVLFVEKYLIGEFDRILYPLFHEQMKMNLQSCKIIVLLLVVRKPSQNHAKLFLSKLLSGIVLKQDDRLVVLPLEQASFFDESQFLIEQFIDQTFEIWFDIFLFVSEDEQIVLVLVPQVLQFDKNELISNTRGVEILDDEVLVVYSVESDAFLLNSYHEFVVYHDHLARLVQSQIHLAQSIVFSTVWHQ